MPVRAKMKSPTGWQDRAMEAAYEGVGKKKACTTNKAFIAACEAAGVQPTARQYSKWSRKIGRWS